ncbi:MAG: hypothetical protein U5L06_13075 [Rhodovibrio sp.]|nr:hypothetical protein [Rhodovibrio sp.]
MPISAPLSAAAFQEHRPERQVDAQRDEHRAVEQRERQGGAQARGVGDQRTAGHGARTIVPRLRRVNAVDRVTV